VLRLVGITLLVAVAAGWLGGGRLRNLAAIRVVALPLAFGSAACVVAARFAGGALGTALQVSGIAAVGAFLAVNATRLRGCLRAGLAILAVGWLLNAAVIISNGGMPLSLGAYAASGQTDVPTPGEGGFFAIDVAGAHTTLRPLGDVIPIAPLRTVASPGDLVLALGVVIVITAGMRGSAAALRVPATAQEAS
jgi:hypothetical protein